MSHNDCIIHILIRIQSVRSAYKRLLINVHVMAGVMWVTHFSVVEDVTDRALTRYQEDCFIACELECICKYCSIVGVLIHTQICQTGVGQSEVLGQFYNPNTTPKRQR